MGVFLGFAPIGRSMATWVCSPAPAGTGRSWLQAATARLAGFCMQAGSWQGKSLLLSKKGGIKRHLDHACKVHRLESAAFMWHWWKCFLTTLVQI